MGKTDRGKLGFVLMGGKHLMLFSVDGLGCSLPVI